MQDRKKSKKESTREPAALHRQVKNLKTLKNKLKQAEETTHRCKELHNLLLETIPHGIQECDTYGTITYFNASFSRITGYDKDELAGKKIWDFFDSEAEQQGLESYFLTIIKEKPLPTPYTSKMRTKDGRPVIIHVDWNYKYDVQGKLAGFVSVITDITKRRQTEENLLKEIIFSQSLINSLPGFFYLIDPDGGFIRWNRNIEEFYGYSSEEFTKLKVLDLVADKDKELAGVRMQEVLTKGQSSAEVEVITKDSKTIPFLFTGVRIDLDGKPYMVGVGIDISRRKEAEKRLNIQYSVTKLLAESADISETLSRILQVICENIGWEVGEIWQVDADSSALLLNSMWNSPSLDITEFEAISKQTVFSQGEGLPGRVWKSSQPAWIIDVVTDTNFKRASVASKSGLHAGFAFPLRSSGKVVGVLSFFSRDIQTPDDDLLEMFDALGNQIGGFIERKQTEKEIAKAHKLESIGILAGGIAHDFNNLLTVILGNISLLKIYISKEHKMYDRLTDAENACMKAKELSYRLLTFSKGGEPLKEETLISNILKRTVTLTLGYSSASYELIIPDDLYPVKIDEGQIEQVLRNIVTNAREAIPDGGTIRVYAENISVSKENRLPLKEGNYVKISIEDRGCGISEENLPKIFDPYFTTKDIGAEKGQGLGLSICYSVIKAHGGLISVESRTGIGTTVYIYLPAF